MWIIRCFSVDNVNNFVESLKKVGLSVNNTVDSVNTLKKYPHLEEMRLTKFHKKKRPEESSLNVNPVKFPIPPSIFRAVHDIFRFH